MVSIEWSISPDQRGSRSGNSGGVIREDLHRLALEQRDLLVKDKAFYRRLLDGDMAAKEKVGPHDRSSWPAPR